jgi:hypothetical protein
MRQRAVEEDELKFFLNAMAQVMDEIEEDEDIGALRPKKNQDSCTRAERSQIRQEREEVANPTGDFRISCSEE